MNREIPFLDMRRSPGDIINCWIVYLMPFDSDERSDYDKIHAFQQACIDNNIFGMGWDLTKEPLHFGTPIQEGAEIYKERYGPNRSMEYALNQYKSIRKGDYVLMRLKNGHYYVGRTAGSAIYLQQDQEPFANLSWGCQVERWEEYTSEEDIPSELRGRFSQRRHSTIQRMDKYRPRLLTMKLYEDRQAEPQLKVPHLRFTRENFVRCLDYRQLEDLVALYIWERHGDNGYMLLPSSGKTNQQKYEFRFINARCPGQKPISCQVKNQEEISIEHYNEESDYEKIYLFSGKWSDEVAAAKQSECASNVTVIRPSNLYDTLCHNSIFNSRFYRVADDDEISIEDIALGLRRLGYTDAGHKLRKRASRQYVWDSGKREFLDFVVSDGLFYSEEFGALVRSWGDYSPEEIETIQADLAKCIGMNEHRDEMKQ